MYKKWKRGAQYAKKASAHTEVMQKPMNSPTPEQLQEEARTFRNRFRNMRLSTSTPDGIPDLGNAPFVLDDREHICIPASELATQPVTCRAIPGPAWLSWKRKKHAATCLPENT
jgi:hypothetical protein